MGHSIDPRTHIGTVALTVSSLDQSLPFYQERLGFQLHRREGATAALGAGGRDLLLLTEDASAPRTSRTTGLYHFAVLLPSRLELAQALRRLAETRTPLQGASDHLVSEALYLADPDSNGIEIYRDRPREEWPYAGDQVQMSTDPLDIDGVIDQLEGAGEWAGLPPETVIGHVHLHVARLPETETFYVGVLGFDLMQRYGQAALFVSAGGYHHHIGLNTWQGVGAPPPPEGAIGLRYFEVRLPDEIGLAGVRERLAKAGVSSEETEIGLLVHDPSMNTLVFTIDPA